MKEKEKVSKYSYLFMMGHICTDISQGGLPAMLPFLIAEHGLSYSAAAGLVFAANFISSIVQPLFGHLGDKIERPWYMALGIILSGIGISLVGIFSSYIMMCVAVVIMGTGVALFHPEGSKMANMVSGSNKGTSMSIFSVGGNVGFAVGPVITSVALLTLGAKGSLVFLIPTSIMTIIMLSQNKKFKEISKNYSMKKEKLAKKQGIIQKDNWKGFTIVSFVMFFRSVVGYGMTTFIPLFFIGVLMQTEAAGNMNLSAYAVAGAIATLAGGRIADKIGFKQLVLICSVIGPVLLLFFSFNRAIILATISIVLFSLFSGGCHGILIVMGQNFLPNRLGMASGILFGLTVSIGGMFAPIVGWIGDHYGLSATMLTLTGFAFLSMVFVFAIPKENKYAIDNTTEKLQNNNSNNE